MKNLLLMLIAILIASCGNNKPKPISQLTDDEIKINVINYIDSVSKGTDLAFVNYQMAYEREGATAPIFSDLEVVKDEKGNKMVETSVLFGNTSTDYKKLKGAKAQLTGIQFKLNGEGKPISHVAYLSYYPEPFIYFDMTKSADHLYNYINK